MTSTPSNHPNPFVTGDADALRDLLVNQLRGEAACDGFGVFRGRAVALAGTIAPVLACVRDHKGVPINMQQCRYTLQLGSLCILVTHRVFLARDAETGAVGKIQVHDMPAAVIEAVKSYLGEIPGYDTSREWLDQKSDRALEQHSYALMYLAQPHPVTAGPAAHA
jgi:intracellular multiplication protein IcmO